MSALWIASYVALWLVVALLAFILMGVLRQLGLIQMRVGVEPGVLVTREGLDRGAKAPEFEAVDAVTGRIFRLSELHGRRVVLVFLTPTCGECRTLASQLRLVAEQWQEVQFLAVCYGSAQACLELAGQTALRVPLLLDVENEMAADYAVSSTPFAYLLDEEGTVLIRGIANTWPQIEALLEERGTLRSGISIDDVIAEGTLLPSDRGDPHMGNGAHPVSGRVPASQPVEAQKGGAGERQK